MTDETEIQETITPTASMPSGNTPQDIVDIYNVLAPMSTDYTNANMERAGQAQASYGPLAQAAMGDSQTAGIGNYTYNRLVRPSVDVMRDQLIVSGLSTALNKQINDSLDAAKRNYQRAARRRSLGGTGGDKDDDKSNKKWDGKYDEDEEEEEKKKGSDYNPDDYVKGDYNFYNYGNVPGQTGKYPLAVDTPMFSTNYEIYTSQHGKDAISKGKAWVEFLYKIGYTG